MFDREAIVRGLTERYQETHKKSRGFFQGACQYQVRGGSHNLRLPTPFPFYDAKCSGSRVTDLDGNSYVDFWQGHFANIMGHNPPIILEALIRQFQQGQGLITGFPGTQQRELATLILSRVPADKIRFTTSGALAAMYAIMLAKSSTRRNMVMKIAGGWHGAQPFGLKGVSAYDHGLDKMESAGLPASSDSEIMVTRFNDPQDLEEKFRLYGERTACLILEPMLGAGGFIFAQRQYLQRARELTAQYGVVLILDEVVTGFRFHPGGIQSLYGIIPDLSVFGKSIGGGMPVSAVAGKEALMSLAGPDTAVGKKVRFDGGTFSAHPASILAGVTFIKYLIEHQEEVYPRLGVLGAKVRRGIEEIFGACGWHVKCTGEGRPVTEHSSIVGVHFLNREIEEITAPEQSWDPEVNDFQLRERIFKLAMLEEGFNIFHGYGGISTAHTDAEIQASLDAVERIAKKWSKERKAT